MPSLLDVGIPLRVTAGRTAIAVALELMGVAPGQNVLMPAYHCASMVEALSWVSAVPVFYRVRSDLSVDLPDVEKKITNDTRVLVVVNYFGFARDLDKIQAFCATHEISMLEDCAHSFFGEYKGRPLGSFGQFATGSFAKFFPVREGGCLVSRDIPDLASRVQLAGRPLSTNIRDALDSLEISTRYGRLPGLKPFAWGAEAARSALYRYTGSRFNSLGPRPETRPAQQSADTIGGFDKSWVKVCQSGASAAICRWTSRQRIKETRRNHYRKYLEAFSEVKGARPLFSTLPEGIVPFMFPLWVDRLESLFEALEDSAIPMQRFGQFLWPGVDETVCSESFRFSKKLIQFPCHQELTDREVSEIIDSARKHILGANRRTQTSRI